MLTTSGHAIAWECIERMVVREVGIEDHAVHPGPRW